MVNNQWSYTCAPRIRLYVKHSNYLTHTTLVNGCHITYCIMIYQLTCCHVTRYILPVDLIIRSAEGFRLSPKIAEALSNRLPRACLRHLVRLTHSQHKTKTEITGKDGTARIPVCSLSLVLMRFMLVRTGSTEKCHVPLNVKVMLYRY